MTADEIRWAAMEAGEDVRRMTSEISQSADRDRLLEIMNQSKAFWLSASDTFLQQWLLVALAEAERP